VLVSLAWWMVLAVDAAAWTVWALLAGWWHRRTPHQALHGDGAVLRLRRFEMAGSWYEQRLRIKRWKDRLPETGGRFGGMSKRRLPGPGIDDLERFRAECCRGERTHWTIVAATPAFALWTPRDLFLAIAGCGVAGNAPFMAVLRYNRARITSILQRGTSPDNEPCATSAADVVTVAALRGGRAG
jgi:glycosyl-4,4'-diaponeurosporenoate acyltransferase